MNNVEVFLPILFKVLLAFIFMNMVINTLLLFTRRAKIYKLMALYWPSLLAVFFIVSMFQSGNLEITFAYSVSIIPATIFAMIGFEVVGRKFPLVRYALLSASAFPLSYALDKMGLPFTYVALPMSLATGIPLFHAFLCIEIFDRNKSTRLQKILGFLHLGMAIHSINFALFRMDPGAQLWGWFVSYAMYDFVAVMLPAIALEESNISENERLQKLVELKTLELNQTLKENENLLKVVLHDISSPIMTMRFFLSILKISSENEETLEKIKKSHNAIERIILQVKEIYGRKNGSKVLELKPVSLEECFNDVEFIYSEKLRHKNISLRFNNQLPKGAKVLADQVSLTHSVISNLVSNALKFSFPHSSIEISAKLSSDQTIDIEVTDQGPGIPQHVVSLILDGKETHSNLGTGGELGSGYGLSIAKSFIDNYGGKIEFQARPKDIYPHDHGTKVTLNLPLA